MAALNMHRKFREARPCHFFRYMLGQKYKYIQTNRHTYTFVAILRTTTGDNAKIVYSPRDTL